MDIRNGNIYTADQVARMTADAAGGALNETRFLRPMVIRPSPEQLARPPVQPARRAVGRVGRNDPCPCGSGKKFKKCCLA